MNDITRDAGVSEGHDLRLFRQQGRAVRGPDRGRALRDLRRPAPCAGAAAATLRDTLIRYGIALVTKIMSEKVRAARSAPVIGISDAHTRRSAPASTNAGPKQGHRKLAEFCQARRSARGLADSRLRRPPISVTDLCFAGLFRQRIFGYRTGRLQPRKSASARHARASISSCARLCRDESCRRFLRLNFCCRSDDRRAQLFQPLASSRTRSR